MTLRISRGSKLAQDFREQWYAELGEVSEMSHKADFLMSESKEKAHVLELFNHNKIRLSI